jgi:transcription initiation factor IIE alpha subunit
MSEDIEVQTTVTLQFTCGECGQALDTSQKTSNYSDDITVHVDPCSTCVQKAKDEGYEEGQADS